MRRWLRVCGVLLVAMCLLDVWLFRAASLDWVLAFVAFTAALCFLYQRFWRTMAILNAVWLLMCATCFLGGASLVYHMVLAVFARATAQPLPPAVHHTPAPAEDLAAMQEFYRRFPQDLELSRGKPLVDAVEVLRMAGNRVKDASMPPAGRPGLHKMVPVPAAAWDAEFADAKVQDAIRQVELLMEEYWSFHEAHRPTWAVFKHDLDFGPVSDHLRFTELELICLRYAMQQPDSLPEVRARFLRLLRAQVHQLGTASCMMEYLVEISALRLTLNFLMEQAEHPLLAGLEPELLPLVQEARRLSRNAAILSLKGEIAAADQLFADMEQRARGGLPPIALGELAPLNRRFELWPFHVREHTLGVYGRFIYEIMKVLDAERGQVALAWTTLQEENLAWQPLHLVVPNPYGAALNSRHSGAFTSGQKRRLDMELRLVIVETAISWRTSPGSALPQPVDPITGQPLITQLTHERSATGAPLERLVLAGGGKPDGLVRPPEIHELLKYGLAGKAAIAWSVTRPVATAAEVESLATDVP